VLHLLTSKELKQVVTDTHYLKHYVTMNKEELKCEWCDKTMTEEEHHFCDICSDCWDENHELYE